MTEVESFLSNLKRSLEQAISTATFAGKKYSNGAEAKTALIRSSQIINPLHDLVKNEFVNLGVTADSIYPTLGKSSPEIPISGALKAKKQDIVITPDQKLVTLARTGHADIEKIISVNVRSQLSSLQKNIDTLYERTFAEALNLHLNYPSQCLGDVYLIPAYEYDDTYISKNEVVFKAKPTSVAKYITMFQLINNRKDTGKDEYMYERIALLIVDFRKPVPKLYVSAEELKKDGLLEADSTVSMQNLTLDGFAKDLLSEHTSRFGNLFSLSP